MTPPAPLLSCRPETFRIQNQQLFLEQALLSSLSRWYGGINISPCIVQVIGESRVCSSPAEAIDLGLFCSQDSTFPEQQEVGVLCRSTDQIPSALGYLELLSFFFFFPAH